jgi:photosystem II stability/assembly factor-like uncharacterized protein
MKKHFTDDNPLLRSEENKSDRFTLGNHQLPGDLRLNALELMNAGLLHVGEPPVSRASNWVQVGPTAIPNAGTVSYYYYDRDRDRALANGRVTTIVVDSINSDIIYLGAAQGGVWKTKDRGRNWTATSDFEISLAIGALAMDPSDHLILYAGTGEGNYSGDSYYGNGILKTTNGGVTWENFGLREFALARFSRIVVHPKRTAMVFAAVTSSDDPDIAAGIYRSVDGGKTWTHMKGGLPATNSEGATDIVLDPTKPDIAYAAFYRKGIYKTEESTNEEPFWKPLNIEDLEPESFNRIALGISSSSPDHVYALITTRSRPIDEKYDDPYKPNSFRGADGRQYESSIIDHFYRSTNGGENWERIPLPGAGTLSTPWEKDSIGGQGTYNLNIAVDLSTPDIVYLSGISLWKAVRNSKTYAWSITDIGKLMHPDNHALAFDPKNTATIFAGNDGGIYRSENGGETWDDTINEGLCITQFEFMAQHPTSDTLILAGTQDNGTLQFRNTSAFYRSAGGDGGFVAIDPKNPKNFLRQYVKTSLYRSTRAGQIDKWTEKGWTEIDEGIRGSPCLFYAPFVLDTSDSRNIAFGSDRIFLDVYQGNGRWRAPDSPIELPNLLKMEEANALGLRQQELISAINYVNSDPGLIYAGTNYGKVFRVTRTGGQWQAVSVHDFPPEEELRERKVWDIATYPTDSNTIVVVMAGFGSKEKPRSHVWRGRISSKDETAKWEDITPHSNEGRIIDVPVNAVVIDDLVQEIMYIGTDIGVFRTNNAGKSWTKFSEGLPNCAIFDMKLYTKADKNGKPKQLLRVATHGRGIWERRLDVDSMPNVDIYVRDHLMDTGRFIPSQSNLKVAFDDPLRNIDLDKTILYWHMCPDIKVDAPPYKFKDSETVDYIKFEYELPEADIKRGQFNHIYVQIHNRGIRPAGENPTDQVKIRLLYADITQHESKYPLLPSDFWKGSSNNSFDQSIWKQIGDVKPLPYNHKTLTNTEPTILDWVLNIDSDKTTSVCLLLVVDSPEDPIPEANKNIFDIENLVRIEKRIGLKKVNVVDA